MIEGETLIIAIRIIFLGSSLYYYYKKETEKAFFALLIANIAENL